MTFGGDADEAASKELYAACRDAGIFTFDTADVYNGGASEEILGRLIKDHRDEVVIASKAYFPSGMGPNERGASRLHLQRSVEASLRRLQTDTIDIYYVHRFDEATSLEQTFRCLDDLVRSGKILYPALSNFAAWQVMKTLSLCDLKGWARPTCIQPMYNLVKRQVEVELLPMAESERIGVMPYSPLAAGLLAGKWGRDRAADAGRLANNKQYQIRYGAPHMLDAADGICTQADQLGVHPATLAIAWVRSHPAVTAPIIGARNLEQLGPCLAAASLDLDVETRAMLSELSPEPATATDRNEEKTPHAYGVR